MAAEDKDKESKKVDISDVEMTDADNVKPEGKEAEKNTKKDEKKEEDELSEEDAQLKSELEMLVARITESDVSLHTPSLEAIRNFIRSSTTSMTSVPKPLKFLRPHYTVLKDVHARWADSSPSKKLLADIISVLAMTAASGAEDGSAVRECLRYRLKGACDEVGLWGHEYVRHLSGEVGQSYQDILLANASGKEAAESSVDEVTVEQLVALATEIVPYTMKHNAEAEAADLLMELERLDLLSEHVDKESYKRVCLYLCSCVPYVPEPEDSALLKTALAIFRKFGRYPEAMKLAVQLNDPPLQRELMDECEDELVKKQMTFMLARQQVSMDLEDDPQLNDIISNATLSEHFLSLARELDVMEPKTPEDIYKSHLENTHSSFGGNVDSAKQNLASTFVNAFVNVAFGSDKLMTDKGSQWIFKNKNHGMISAAASLGMVLQWDVSGGLAQIDKYLYHNDQNIKAGALMACGIVNAGIRDECDSALALLTDYITHSSNVLRVGAIVGLGLAYAGSAREDVVQLLLPVLSDPKSNMEVIGVTAIALGQICVGTCDGEVTESLIQFMLERPEADLKETHARNLALGLALVYLGKQEDAQTTLAALEAVAQPLSKVSQVFVEACAYAGTGNVLKVQSLLHLCSEHYDKDKNEDDQHQMVAVMGIALVAMGEDIGADMALRSIGHLLHYGEIVIRRACPMALALLSVSNPRLSVLDVLSKLSHDSDLEVAVNSILALGIVGAGTNNARLAAMLRQLASYYHKEPNCLFAVRVAQGLVHMGKGTMTLSAYHANRSLMSPVSVAGLLGMLTACMDVKKTLLDKQHYMMYYLVSAIHPRMLLTLDEDLNALPVSVRVGQAVDVVGQAGHPKTITGFQTHTTPVLLAHGERAELATEEYLPLTPILEGFVILRKNPEFVAAVEESGKK